MPKAFISYARDGSHGENLAVDIQQQLQAAGFAVFRDVIGLKPGDVWYRTLEFELETSDVMVLVVSEKVRSSKWVHNEVSMAEEIGIPVIPVLAEKIRYPLWLRHLQSLDFCVTVDWNVLIEAIGHHLGRPAVVGEQEKEPQAEPVAGRYIIHDNGTVTDTATKLMWKRCSEGQSGMDCSGEPARYTWDDAMSKFGRRLSFAGYNDWRMPIIEELRTLIHKGYYPAINQAVFPATPDRRFWSLSERDVVTIWVVGFDSGCDDWSSIDNALPVRLVRSEQ